uniref:Uncharacterized protein n=1 Tax=Romanomermis culicivorax TaxID=13658 RepID=A0A915I8Y5_ROMCU
AVESLSGIEEALIKLPDLLQNNCPKALLVLDDVVSEYHVTKFDELYCRS